MKIKHAVRKKPVLITGLIVFALLGIVTGIIMTDRRADAPKAAASTSNPASKPTSQNPAPISKPDTPFNKSLYSTSDPSSLWVIVNKQHPLSPIDYAPNDLVSAYGHQVSSRMVADLTNMINDSAEDGAYLTIVSSYRSFPYQVNLYDQYVKADGQAEADTYSARAGFSEHQTGLAVDFGNKAGTCSVEDCYADTTEGKWLAANAYRYGFLLRYTAEKQAVTGYEAEAWHYRYIGKDLSTAMHAQNISTLEEFFSVTGGESYIQ